MRYVFNNVDTNFSIFELHKIMMILPIIYTNNNEKYQYIQ